MNTEEDVILAVANELGLPKEQVHVVVFSFWKTIKYYLSNPHLVKGGLSLTGFGKFRLSVQKLERFINRAMFGTAPLTPARQDKVDYIKDVLKTKIQKYESGQRKSPEDKLQKRTRLEGYIGRERSYVKEGDTTYDLLQYKEYQKRLAADKRIQRRESDKQ